MKFKIDESLPSEAAASLNVAGHDAISVFDQEMSGASDAKIASICRREGRVLVTLDTGFADIRNYPPARFSGMVVLRLQKQDKPSVLSVLQAVLRQMETEPLSGRLWIVEEDRIRVRM